MAWELRQKNIWPLRNRISSHLKSFIELLNLNGKNLTSHALKTLFYYYRLKKNNYEKFR
jgi:hypothetical protein